MTVSINGEELIYEPLGPLREIWEETSDRLELLQTTEQCVKEQIEWRKSISTVYYHANFEYGLPPVVRKGNFILNELTFSVQLSRKSQFCVKKVAMEIEKWLLHL